MTILKRERIRPEDRGFGEAFGGDPGFEWSALLRGVFSECDEVGAALLREAAEEERPVLGGVWP
jgi:hypothetical protein